MFLTLTLQSWPSTSTTSVRS